MRTDLRNRAVEDVFLVVCDGLKGLPDSISAAFPLATVRTCIIHLIETPGPEVPDFRRSNPVQPYSR